MVTTALWTYILASTTCISAYAVSGGHSTRANQIACGRNDAVPLKRGSQVIGRTNNAIAHSLRTYNTSGIPIPIDVQFHVLSADGTEEGGDISDARLKEQMEVLKNAFEPTGFTFDVVGTDRIVNAQWYDNLKVASKTEEEVSLALRKGDNATLNVYTMGASNTINPGWATLPSDLGWRPQYDGIFINGTTFPGGTNQYFREGMTLVHEVGHWFGLLHPSGAGCEQSYDFVADTPVEDTPEMGGCPIGLDSCPDKPGLDLIHNYMAFTEDSCRNSWTPGQIQRMREQMAKFRGVVYPGIDVDKIPEDSYDE